MAIQIGQGYNDAVNSGDINTLNAAKAQLEAALNSNEVKVFGQTGEIQAALDKVNRDIANNATVQRGNQAAQAAQQEAANFDANYQKNLSRDQGLSASQGRQQLAQTIAGNNKNANSRGLLYSGLRSGANAQATAQNQSQTAQNQADLASQYQQRGQQLRETAMDASTNRQQFMQNQAYARQMQALGQQANQTQAMGQIGSGIGTLTGAIAGRAQK